MNWKHVWWVLYYKLLCYSKSYIVLTNETMTWNNNMLTSLCNADYKSCYNSSKFETINEKKLACFIQNH